MSQYGQPGVPQSGPPAAPHWGAVGQQQPGQWGPRPPAAQPGWLAGRTRMEAASIGIGALGLLTAVFSLSLPWEYHPSSGEYSSSYYVGATGSAGWQYGLGLMLLVGCLITGLLAPRRFSVPVRWFGSAVALLQLGLLTGAVVLAKLDRSDTSASGRTSPETEVSWGLIIAFVAVISFGAAVALAQRAREV
ncbi:MAG: hypothetical protein ACRDT8_07205 [Micromonosporaceae bacterium]